MDGAITGDKERTEEEKERDPPHLRSPPTVRLVLDGKPSSGGFTISVAYVTSQLGQLSLASLRGRLTEYQLRLG